MTLGVFGSQCHFTSVSHSFIRRHPYAAVESKSKVTVIYFKELVLGTESLRIV